VIVMGVPQDWLDAANLIAALPDAVGSLTKAEGLVMAPCSGSAAAKGPAARDEKSSTAPTKAVPATAMTGVSCWEVVL
jgi:hypothetical protein